MPLATRLLDGIHPAKTLSRADRALYVAKNQGRDATLCYEVLVDQGLLEPLDLSDGQVDLWAC